MDTDESSSPNTDLPAGEAPQASTTADRVAALYPDAEDRSPADAPDAETKAEPPATDAEPYKLAMPEGVELDSGLMEAAAPVLRQIGLSNEQAQQLVPLVSQVQERLLDEQMDAFATERAAWVRSARSDPEIGGQNWEQSIRLASVALDAGGAPRGSEFRQLLDDSGLGDHPAAIKLFARLGRRLQAVNTQAPRDAAATLYPRN
jgi:hypothetical protein